MKCKFCGSSNVIKYGKLKTGKQVYFCKACRRYWVENAVFHKYPESVRSKALSLFLQGVPVREISKEFLIPRSTIYKWIEKYCKGDGEKGGLQ
ncbi:MAG: helix-turn-helix domain-containing protein [Candidatus Aramenus sp.]|jgi:transposase-like protein|nr:helix-turn-helix domain-containing protein [Candidatus Aramenus sp.]